VGANVGQPSNKATEFHQHHENLVSIHENTHPRSEDISTEHYNYLEDRAVTSWYTDNVTGVGTQFSVHNCYTDTSAPGSKGVLRDKKMTMATANPQICFDYCRSFKTIYPYFIYPFAGIVGKWVLIMLPNTLNTRANAFFPVPVIVELQLTIVAPP